MPEPAVYRTRQELFDAREAMTGPVAVVMTLGALHGAHRSLMRAASRWAGSDGHVLVTIFVNPLQFGAGEDFDKYPRTLGADLAVCAKEGVDGVFAPSGGEMYPNGAPVVTVNPGPLGTELEGQARPTHFAGVLTVVSKLLNLTRPDFAIFGEKDYQQLTLIRQMVADLNMPYEIVAAPTVRDDDGLAMSSRNAYLSLEQRELALALHRSLIAGKAAAPGGPEAVLKAACATLGTAARGIDVDYVELRGADLSPDVTSGRARLLVAARVGVTRLIDNVAIDLA